MIDFPTLLGAFGLTEAQVLLVLVAGAIVLGLTQVWKRMGVPDNLSPLAALATGIAIMELVAVFSEPRIHPIAALLIGIIIALRASGMWSWGKTATGN
jgi:hypothetical protein